MARGSGMGPRGLLLSRYSVQLRGPFSEERFRDLAVLVTQDAAALPTAPPEVSHAVRCEASPLSKAKEGSGTASV
jgi:hypothetical protein